MEITMLLSYSLAERFRIHKRIRGLVCSLRSEAIQKLLRTEANLSLEKATEISTSMEIAVREAQQLSASTQLHKVSVSVVNKYSTTTRQRLYL